MEQIHESVRMFCAFINTKAQKRARFHVHVNFMPTFTPITDKGSIHECHPLSLFIRHSGGCVAEEAGSWPTLLQLSEAATGLE